MPAMPKHTQRSKATPHISDGRVAVQTMSENTSENSRQKKLKANSTLKPNLQRMEVEDEAERGAGSRTNQTASDCFDQESKHL